MTMGTSMSSSSSSAVQQKSSIPSGVVTGNHLQALYAEAREQGHVIPSFPCSCASTCNDLLEAARRCNTAIGIHIDICNHQTLDTKETVRQTVALAFHIRTMSLQYKVPVVLHSEHCSTTLAALDAILEADQDYFQKHGEPLFSSHGIHCCQDPYWQEHVEICKQYFADWFVPNKLWLEVELGECFDATTATTTRLPQHAHVLTAAKALARQGDMFSLVLSSSAAIATLTNADASPPDYDTIRLLQKHYDYQIMDPAEPKRPVFFVVKQVGQVSHEDAADVVSSKINEMDKKVLVKMAHLVQYGVVKYSEKRRWRSKKTHQTNHCK